MQPPLDARTRGRIMVLWTVWGSILAGLVVLYLVFGRKPVATTGSLGIVLGAFAALFVSIVIRWLVVPRFTDLVRVFPMFVIGLALAEGCGILGIFLGGPYRDALWVLGVLGVTSYVPLFARRLADPKGSGFIPNN
jgi:hypothetical protein